MAGAFQPGIGEDDGELLAAVAAGRVAFPLHAGGHRRRNLPQRVVAGEVAAAVVEQLEMVHIQHQQGERLFAAA
ncbi:hypothetical protein D3C72_2526780 [compost metagenome]